MKIEIECEWDEGDLIPTEVSFEGRSIPYMGSMGVNIHRTADCLTRLIGNWKTDEDKRNVSP